MDRPIPAFYACYLLRSINRHSSLYVGSTPNPARRLKQHNGVARGGAVRTSRASLRPWEMTCLVTGFPSKIAALQFEWAWQNPNLTRHIPTDSRITQATMLTRISPKTGRIRRRPARPRLCLTDRLANLHLLLRSPSFERWPLKVTFYAADVYRVWQRGIDRQIERLPLGLEVVMHELDPAELPPSGQSEAVAVAATAGPIQALDVGYAGMKPYLERSMEVFGRDATKVSCMVCEEKLEEGARTALLCPSCGSLAHLRCMSTAFLQAGGRADTVVPVSGQCPSCDVKLKWGDLVKELSLRLRGQKEVEAVFKPKRMSKVNASSQAAALDQDDSEAASSEDDPLDLCLDEDEDISEEESPAVIHPTAPARRGAKPTKPRKTRPKARVAPLSADHVVEDSEWDDAEIVR